MKFLSFILFFIFISEAQADYLKLLRDDREALQARVDVIQQAKNEILVEYYSVWNDDQSLGGMALLMDAAKRGVKVKVILDALSTIVPRKTLAALMIEGKDSEGNQNLEIKEYNPMGLNILKATHRDHAKMIIVDGEVLITGGRNVGDKYFGISRNRNFSDLDLLAKGGVAHTARENFLETWRSKVVKHKKLKQYDPAQLNKECPPDYYDDTDHNVCIAKQMKARRQVDRERARIHGILNDILTVEGDDLVMPFTGKDWFVDSYEQNNLRFVSHGTAGLVTPETAYLNEAMMEVIGDAQEEVSIISPYLIPTQELYQVFQRLVERRVRIRIITNSLRSTDNLFAQAGYREIKPHLIKMGIEIYEYEGPDTIHAKTVVVDNHLAVVGTYNIDPRSAYINREIAVIVENTEGTGIIDELNRIIDEFRSNSILVGQNGMAYNQELEFKGVSRLKRRGLKYITFLLPWIRNQL